MNPSYSQYPPQQHGLYAVQPSLQSGATTSPNQVVFNIGSLQSPQPAAYVPQPDAYPPKPATYAPQQAAYAPYQAANAPQPVAYPPKPVAYAPQPDAYASQPASCAPQSDVYPQNPAAYPTQPCYAPQTSFSPQHLAPFYPSQASYHSAPIPPYPPVSEISYPPTPAAPYPSTCGFIYPPQPTHHHESAPPTSVPLNHSQPTSGGSCSSSLDLGAGEQPSSNPPKKSQDSNVARESPTLTPVTPFNPQADAQIIRKAMKSLISIDKQAIINVLTARSNKQRLEIAFHYQNMYDKNLITALQNELTFAGFYQDLMVALLKPLPEFLASKVQKAITGWGSNEKTLVEILCTASNMELDAIKAEYSRLYHRPMEKDLISAPCGNFERLLLASMMQARRPENTVVDEITAMQDAQSLVTGGLLRMGGNETSFFSILCTRSYAHLRRVFKIYNGISGKHLEHAVNSQFNGGMKKGLLALIQCIEDRAGFFADRIYDATSSFGLKDKHLIRVVVSRCEIDLQTVKESYQKRYGKRMEVDISRATSGHYRKTLLALVGGYN